MLIFITKIKTDVFGSWRWLNFYYFIAQFFLITCHLFVHAYCVYNFKNVSYGRVDFIFKAVINTSNCNNSQQIYIMSSVLILFENIITKNVFFVNKKINNDNRNFLYVLVYKKKKKKSILDCSVFILCVPITYLLLKSHCTFKFVSRSKKTKIEIK